MGGMHHKDLVKSLFSPSPITLQRPHTEFYSLQVNIFTEEIIRAGSAASVSSLLNRLDPILRQTAHLGKLILISLPALWKSYHS